MDAVEQKLWRAYRRWPKSIKTRNALLVHYMPYVREWAEKMYNKINFNVTVEELISAGMDGLLQCIERFDPKAGARFTTYAPMRIKGAMTDWIRQMDIVPRLVRTKQAKVEKLKEEMMKVDRVRNCDVYAKLGFNAEDIDDLEHRTGSGVSTSTIVMEKEWQKDVELGETLPSNYEGPEARSERLDFMREALKGLNQVERLLMINYYYNDQTMKEIADTLGLSESRISQMHSKIITRLRAAGRAEALCEYAVN